MFDSNDEENDDDDNDSNDDGDDVDDQKEQEDDDEQQQEEEESWKDVDFLGFSGATASSSSKRAAASSDIEDDDEDDDDEDAQLVTLDAPWMNGGQGGFRPPISVNHLNRIHPLVRLHNEIVWFVRLIEPTAEEIRAREQLVQRIRGLVKKTFEKSGNHGNATTHIQVFGSQATNLFLPTSDIDIVVYTKDTSNTSTTTDEKQQEAATSPLHTFAGALREEWGDSELSYLDIIENTKVPLVKFTHKDTNVCIDVCFDQATGPPAAQLMTQYLDALPPLRPLTFCLKQFLVARGLNEPYSGGVGSFLLQLMIVSFLQQRERYAVHFQRPTLNNLGCMLLEFLQLFGTDFNYATTAISVRNDGYYFSKGRPDTRDVFFNASRPLSLALENPLDAQHDVGTSSFRMPIVQRAFGTAYRILLAHVTDHAHPSGISTAEALASIFGDNSGTTGNSILASILPSTQEMQQRALYKQRHSSTAATASTTTTTRSTSCIPATSSTNTAAKKIPNRSSNNNNKRNKNNNKNSNNNSSGNGRKRQRR
jgi:non-canonical poly(A) RNA polymerase PAPD5/7